MLRCTQHDNQAFEILRFVQDDTWSDSLYFSSNK